MHFLKDCSQRAPTAPEVCAGASASGSGIRMRDQPLRDKVNASLRLELKRMQHREEEITALIPTQSRRTSRKKEAKKGSKKLGHGSQLHVTISSSDKHKKKRKKKVNIQEILAKELLASNSSVGHVLAAAQHPGEEEEEEGSNWGGVDVEMDAEDHMKIVTRCITLLNKEVEDLNSEYHAHLTADPSDTLQSSQNVRIKELVEALDRASRQLYTLKGHRKEVKEHIRSSKQTVFERLAQPKKGKNEDAGAKASYNFEKKVKTLQLLGQFKNMFPRDR